MYIIKMVRRRSVYKKKKKSTKRIKRRSIRKRSFGVPRRVPLMQVTPPRRVPLKQVTPPLKHNTPKKSYNSIEYNLCVEQCKNNENIRSDKDRKRMEAFDEWEKKWKKISEEEERIGRKRYKSPRKKRSIRKKKEPKLYKSTKGTYYNKRYKDPHTGKTKTKRVYVNKGLSFGNYHSWPTMEIPYDAKYEDIENSLAEGPYTPDQIRGSMEYLRKLPNRLKIESDELEQLSKARRKRIQEREAKYATMVPGKSVGSSDIKDIEDRDWKKIFNL